MSHPKLRAELQTALLNLATGDLRTSATALLGKLGYANPLSHSQTVDRYRREIEDAIYAVDDLVAAVHRALQVQKTRPIELLQYLATALNARAVQLSASP
jgi:hypothetical protein